MQSLTPDIQTGEMAEFEADQTEISLAKRLIDDIENDITHECYRPVRDKLEFYLRHGYKPKEVQGELMLTDSQMRIFRSKIPQDVWESASVRANVHLARKRARLLTESGVSDLAIVQTLDRDWNPKVEHSVRRIDAPLADVPDDELIEMAGL